MQPSVSDSRGFTYYSYNNTRHSLFTAPSTVEATYAVNSDSSFVVTWDVPSVPNGIITQYVVSVYNKRNGFDQSFTVLADQDRTITLSDLCELVVNECIQICVALQ